ncbi:MAG: UPF0182 family protein [DPANN group archaeon]|nr:UPF0182 family protein [DPANN group archaeon]
MARKTTFWIYALIIVLIFASSLVGLLTDYWWFQALGFESIFLISLKAKIMVFLLAAIIFFIFALVNVWIAAKFHHDKTNRISVKSKVWIILGISVIVGWIASAQWFTILQYLNQVSFSLADPILHRDVSFYVFSLPFLLALWSYALAILVITSGIVILDYFQTFFRRTFKQPNPFNPGPEQPLPQMPNIRMYWKQIKRPAIVHITVLLSLSFLLFAAKHYLSQFSIMFSEKGIVVGAGYTDVVVFLPIIKILMIFALVITGLFYVWLFLFSRDPRLKKRHIIGIIVLTYLLFVVVGQTLVPALVQSFRVDPNELDLESPYIQNNINFTRIAYNLDDVEVHDYPAEGKITREMLGRAKKTIDNVRILDYRPLVQTYKQTQEIRLYYDLANIDIDRYTIKGNYTQVMLAARELNQQQLAANSKTWVNLHIIYTHGFGMVMSPVNRVTDQGLPSYFIKDIPPINLIGEPSLDITQPRIYYGEQDNDYVLVQTKSKEFDYPQGSANKYVSYDGKGGVVLDSFFKKVLMAWRFKDIKILLSSDLTKESRIMFDRSVQERIGKITPFIVLDRDPYMVLYQGRMLWIQDGYTITGNFPYSQKIGRLNYIRNSVKVVMDAYDGSIVYYISDEKDPIIQTYARIFPGQFRSIREMPAGLRKHVRYPEDLFAIQANMYSIYHMKDIKVFYNKEDAWQIPSEIYGTGQKVKMEPYYMIMKLPGETGEEFVLLTPFTPIQKDNMISWLAARSDGKEYGKLLLYRFPKDRLVYGPLQIEAKFDQDSDISQLLTLWSQQGSRVTRGNLIVLPIEDALLYVEPLYLQAEQGQLPQLKRVLVSDGDKVVMRKTLGDALESLFGSASEQNTRSTRTESTAGKNETLVEQANRYYQNILDAMESGDWTAMGRGFDKLGNVLDQMK